MSESKNGKPIVSLQDVVKIYSKPGSGIEVHALRGINTDFRRGEYVAVVGASGSGKSTMMNIIGCLDRASGGRYVLNGKDVSGLDDDELSEVRGRYIGFVFQSFNLIPTQTVVENLELPLYYQGVPAHTRREKALELAERVGLQDRLQHVPTELSGGEQQRVAIARSLMNDPVLLLADEPTGNLDSKTGAMILEILDELNDGGMTIAVVTHDTNVAGHCKRTIELHDRLIIRDE